MSAEYRFTPELSQIPSPRLVVYEEPLAVSLKSEKKQQTYTLEFDIDAYQKLRVLQDTDPDEYDRQKDALDATTTFNLVTTLAERLNAAVSRRVDLIDEQGIMRDAFQQRPLIEWYEQGRIARKEQGSSSHDQRREQAEITGQEKMQIFFADAPVGSMAFFLSRPGTEFQNREGEEQSIYKHNFIDISHKVSATEISVMRCMSGLSLDEAIAKLRTIKPGYLLPEEITDSTLLENPIELLPHETVFADPDELHAYLHSTLTDTLSEDEFTIVKNACMPYVRHYLSIVKNVSGVNDQVGRAFNAILNKADEITANIKSTDPVRLVEMTRDSGRTATSSEILAFGMQPVRMVDTGCGFSGGYSTGSTSYGSPMGVLDFGGFNTHQEKDQYGSLEFDCPSCRRVNKRKSGELIPHCQHCGANVRCDTDQGEAKKKSQRDNEQKEVQKRQRQFSEKKQTKKEESFWEILFMQKKPDEKNRAETTKSTEKR